MSKKLIITFACILVAVLGYVGFCLTICDTSDSLRAEKRQVFKDFKSCKNSEITPFLEKLSSEKFYRASFSTSFPWVKSGFRTRVKIDYIGQLTSDAFIRLSGNNADIPVDQENIKKLLAFSETFMKNCSKIVEDQIRERRLDAFFLINDFESAIKILEGGLPRRSPAWCKGTIAKIRFHIAEAKQDWADAENQLIIFNDFMMSDEQKDFEDCDPTTGIVYSREWVVAKNLLRCANCAEKQGKGAKVKEYKSKAKELFIIAETKAKDDQKSLAELQKEIKAANL